MTKLNTARRRRALTASHFVLALAAASMGAAVVSPAQAQDQAERTTFAIPAGDLDRALRQFSEQARVQMVYQTAITAGSRTGGARGALTDAEALGRVLAGTGLTFSFQGEATVTIAAVQTVPVDGERVLGPVRVEGETGDGSFGRAGQAAGVNGVNGSRDITATENTGSFTSGALTIGSKAPRSIQETPQSVSVITGERLEQQNINDFTTALQQAPGVSFAQGQTSLETSFYSRGFEITSIQIDGGAPLTTNFAQLGPGAAYFTQIDLSQYDHVEVLRGAAGLFNGYGDPSGSINLVRKKPLDREQLLLDTELGSWNHYRTMLDVTAPLALEGHLRGRAVFTWQDNEQFYDLSEDQKSLVYSILELDLSPESLVTVGVSITSQDSVPWQDGLPRYLTGRELDLPRHRSFVFPWNRWEFKTTEIFGSFSQEFGRAWTAKLDLTYNTQDSEQKLGFSSGAVNPVNLTGPRLFGRYNSFSSEQFSVEATLSGAFRLFGQSHEVTLGINQSDQNGGGSTAYGPLVVSSSSAPYQPYPGGPRFCDDFGAGSCPADTLRPGSPPINVFDFNPFDPLFTEPASSIPSQRYPELGQVQSVAYLNLRLNPFERLHVDLGARWSRLQFKYAEERFCETIPDSGTPSPTNCVGRNIGDPYVAGDQFRTQERLSWPPSVALSYDISDRLVGYLGYTDIYQDQSSFLDGDLESLDPVTGENYEIGLKWATPDGSLNATFSVYHIEKRGFARQEPDFLSRVRRNPNGSIFFDSNRNFFVIVNDGTEVPLGRPDPYHVCCYVQRTDRSLISEGLDFEIAGELRPGWQISGSYTFNETINEGESFGPDEKNLPFLTIQPEHLYKMWTSYDFGASGARGWLANLIVSAGVNGQSEAYRSGSTCPEDQVGQPDPLTGESLCLVDLVPFAFTVEPYVIVSGRLDYKLNERWSAALNVENIMDETYYQSVGGVSSGNWYGAPRRFTFSLRSKW
ncbi:TonB-dependent receptor [Brevundimonas sp. LM2]|uniref:TonB-dependent siderophore receptor n=1 Tax=Brevundimonas sp. LM2 TaxID=1938605 RepID=UPI00123759A8|nr:TonB-dependent receptor [Brevundimonas sp. LM2]